MGCTLAIPPQNVSRMQLLGNQACGAHNSNAYFPIDTIGARRRQKIAGSNDSPHLSMVE